MHTQTNLRKLHTHHKTTTTLDTAPRLGMSRHFLRSICAVVTFAIANMTLMPLAHGMNAQRSNAAQQAQSAPNAAERYADVLGRLKANTLPAQATAYAHLKTPSFSRSADAQSDIAALQTQRELMQAEWDALRAKWSAAGIDKSVFKEQDKLEAQFNAKHKALISKLQNATSVQGKAALAQFVQNEIAEPTHHPINQANMPWQVQKNAARQPLESTAALNKLIAPVVSSQNLNKKSSKDRGKNLDQNQSRNLPSAADLAPTLDAPQTEAIAQLAASLGNNPHKIYQWVHDNIHFFPSYGSVQGAQDTLDKKSGNAIDTASLLIALLRSAGVNARYVYGVVDIPANKVMNWVGGAQNADAAQQILGQGGIPNMALTSGGQTKTFRLEHVWVEAFVQYAPAGGAKHIGGQTQGDTWIPMDASFKQYKFTEGMDLATAVPFDAQAFADAAQQGATVNEAEGWVQHLNQGAIQAQLNSYQARLKTHIEAQNNGQSTVGEVLGVMQAKIDTLPILDSMLPYVVKNTSASFSEIPNQLRHQFRYQIYADDYSRRIEASPLLEFQAPTVSLAGKKVTIAWVAANEAMQKAMEALWPKLHADGSPIVLSELPQGLPASIALKPQLRVEGELKAEGQGMRAGSEPIGAGAFTTYANIAEWDETTDQLIAGQPSALGLSIQGVSKVQVQTMRAKLDATKRILERVRNSNSENMEIFKTLTSENLTGDMLASTILGYFVNIQTQTITSKNQANIIDFPGLSFGLFHIRAQPNKIYGIVTTGIRFKGFNMDIGHMRSIRWAKDGDKDKWISYNKMKGEVSSVLEHATIEQFWIDRSQCRYQNMEGGTTNLNLKPCGQAVSAVKMLSMAAEQGQKIFIITPENAVLTLPALNIGGSVGEEINAAIAAGKHITIHEKSINKKGFSGYGYSIIDPETGVGGYLIEGKGNGGELTQEEVEGSINQASLAMGVGLSAALLASLMAAGMALAAPLTPLIVPIFFAVMAIVYATLMTILIIETDGDQRGCALAGFGVPLQLFVGKILGSLMAKRVFGNPNIIEKGIAAIGFTWDAAGSFMPSTPIQDCV